MRFATINPINNQLVKRFKQHRWWQVEAMLKKAEFGFGINRTSSFKLRSKRLYAVAELLLNKKHHYAQLISLEMGKPIVQSVAEIEKCAAVCTYYADNAMHFLCDEPIKTEHALSVITHAPMGVLLGVMPWNFPFWQVFRFVAPALMAGNVVLIKHAPNVPQCALAIEGLFREAQFPEGLYQNVFIHHNKVKWLIDDKRIVAITLTGSDTAGAKVAEQAGRQIKKTVLELGGSDPFIVLDDANVKEAVAAGIKSRMLNSGQSCIAAKRFIVLENIAKDFIELAVAEIRNLNMGDPMNVATDVGPLAREDLVKILTQQVKISMKMGAEALIGGNRAVERKGCYFNPTLLIGVTASMPVYKEEVFGPVAPVIVVKTAQEAIDVANDTPYGLGASIWTTDTDKAMRLSRRIQAGCVFVNEMVKSDPRLPFGGVKRSGYGRELSVYGIKEFVNTKTLLIK
jgi:succinate-semialdehyde dehydrogenase/glutarate-semialdehyde dehydrogenase